MDFPNTSKEKVYQVMISRIDGLQISEPAYREKQFDLIKKGIGGFILFGGRHDEIKQFISEAQALARIPLFIASDIERGVGQQIEGTTWFPSQMALAAATDLSSSRDIELFTQAIKSVAAEAKEIGINMPLIPVLDVNRNPDNPIICTRAYSDEPETTGSYGSLCIKILELEGLISCAKHFPGHGDTSTDSHISLPVIAKSREELDTFDIAPFRRAIGINVSSIMIGHLAIPAIDSKPASLSRQIITDLLRKELSFKGLVLTDALNMHALKEFGDAGLECLKAGADILLHPEDADATAAVLVSALEEKQLDPGILDAAVKRIIDRKQELRGAQAISIDFESHAAISKAISRKAVTLVKDSPGLLPLARNAAKIAFAGEEKFLDSSPLTIFPDAGLDEKLTNEILVIAIFTNVAAWKGSSGISSNERDRLKKLIRNAKRSIVISFGSPYVLRYFDGADMLIAAYDSTIQAQEAVIACLKGSSPFRGKLPIKMTAPD